MPAAAKPAAMASSCFQKLALGKVAGIHSVWESHAALLLVNLSGLEGREQGSGEAPMAQPGSSMESSFNSLVKQQSEGKDEA